MITRLQWILLPIVLSFLVSGCALTDRNIITDSHKAAVTLIKNAPSELKKESPLLVVSFVNIDNLEKSTTLGRLLSEQIASKLSQLGYNIKEIRLSHNKLFVMEGEGEFVLSRKLKNIKTSFDTNHILVGTYSIASRSVYVTSRIVRIDDSTIISSYDFKLPGSSDLWELAKDKNGEK